MKKVIRTPKLPGIRCLPLNYKVLDINFKNVEVKRPDGLIVFFDRKKEPCATLLNKVRLGLPAETVIRLVGMVRGFQVAINYAKKYQKPLREKYREQLRHLLKSMNEALALGPGADRVLEFAPRQRKAA
ncbi:MAG: hypothetical protein KF713_18965 [Turneriella sp.]|nr:hypothetical protein [Turneriella sp.]